MVARHYDYDLYRKFLATQLPYALRPAEVKANPPLRYWPEVDDYTMSCGMDITPAGRIWLAWFAGGDNENAVVILAYSDDGGLTFSAPQFILDPGYADCGIHLSAVVANLWTAFPLFHAEPRLFRRSFRLMVFRLRKSGQRPSHMVNTSPNLAWRIAQQANRPLQRHMAPSNLALACQL